MSIGGRDHETREAVYVNALEVLAYLLTYLLAYLLTCLLACTDSPKVVQGWGSVLCTSIVCYTIY